MSANSYWFFLIYFFITFSTEFSTDIQFHLYLWFSQKKLTELRNLDLFNFEVTNTDDYRDKVFELLEGLVYLDGYDRNEQEAEEDEDDDGDISGMLSLFYSIYSQGHRVFCIPSQQNILEQLRLIKYIHYHGAQLHVELEEKMTRFQLQTYWENTVATQFM